MKKLLTLAVVTVFVFVASNAVAQNLSAKVIGTYKMTGISSNMSSPSAPNDKSATVTLKRTDDNTISLVQSVGGSETTITDIKLSDGGDGKVFIHYADDSGAFYGSVVKGKLDYAILYKDDDNNTQIVQVFGSKK